MGTKIISDLCQQISSYSSMLGHEDHGKPGCLPKLLHPQGLTEKKLNKLNQHKVEA